MIFLQLVLFCALFTAMVMYAVRGGDRLAMPDREGPFRAVA